MSDLMARSTLGTTGVEVTRLGLGCSSIAGIFQPVPLDQANATIARAIELGIGYFDTAPQYGMGKSEHIVGNALRDHRDQITLSSKVGRLLKARHEPRPQNFNWHDALPFDAVFDYSYDGIMRSFEDSLQRLGVDRIDVAYVHDIGTRTHGEHNARHWSELVSGGYRALELLRRNGSIGAIGIGANEWEILMAALDIGDWDAFLLAGRFTLLEQGALDPLLNACLQRSCSVIAGAPFNSGVLAGGNRWNYRKVPDSLMAILGDIESICRGYNVALPAAALQFPLLHPAVCCVLPGPRSADELDQIAQWWDVPIPEQLWADLQSRGYIAADLEIDRSS